MFDFRTDEMIKYGVLGEKKRSTKELRNMWRKRNREIWQVRYDGRRVTTRNRIIRSHEDDKRVIEAELYRRGIRLIDRKRKMSQSLDGKVPQSPDGNVLPFTQRTVHNEKDANTPI